MINVYHQLAKYLDELPAGFPPSENGVELRLLERLFNEEEASLALTLTLLGDEARTIAHKTGKPVEQVTSALEQMEMKGLISSSHKHDQPTTYAISQFAVGFYEDQVNRLDAETALLIEEYFPVFWEKGPWKKSPQLRTIPVMQTIPITTEVLPYEQVEKILRSKTHIAVRNCVCRQERTVLGKGCGKPLETCFSFDGAALNTVQSGKGRMIQLGEALTLLEEAKKEGLVLQPANSQNPMFLCACCSCCCGVLRHVKKEDRPGDLVDNPFFAQYSPEKCLECGACVEICPMTAMTFNSEGEISFNQIRCIGCGLCVSVCPVGALQLVRKPEKSIPKIPRDTIRTYIQIARSRGISNLFRNGWILTKGLISRLKPPKKLITFSP